MKIKKLLMPLLCLMLVCMCVFTASAASITFSDVGKGKWYTPHIEYAVDNGIFNGTSATTFSPGTNMTRAQFVQVFANMSGVDTSNKNVKTQFSDVPSGKWYTPAVKWASENGVVNGMGDGKFAPEQPVTREQMCVMLVNYVEKFQKKSLDFTVNAQTFKDDVKIASWAKTSVYKCAKTGLVNGVGENKFDPQGTTTRAQGATFFSNFHKYSNPCSKGHTVVIDKAIDATCSKGGLTEGSHCSICKKVIVSQRKIEAINHSLGDTYEGFYCIHCNELIPKDRRIELENMRHSLVLSNCIKIISEAEKSLNGESVPEESGFYRGLLNEINQNIDNLEKNITYYQSLESYYGKDYSSSINSARAALEKEKGEKSKYEHRLWVAEQQELIATWKKTLENEEVIHGENLKLIEAKYNCLEKGHTNINIDEARSATCGRKGLSAGSHCEDCKTIIVPQSETPAFGHSYGKEAVCSICNYPQPSEGLLYTLRSDRKSYSVSIGTCTSKNVVIADNYNGLPVVEIGNNGFYKSNITSIVLPENIHTIGDYAFFRCESLKEITLPSTLERIGKMSFYYCNETKRITFGGTMAQWNSLDRTTGWYISIGNFDYIVNCKDGEIIV